jgi:hypothetical protein
MRPVVALGVLSALLLVGCYGSTEPATNMRPDSVQLNGRGTANHGPAYTFFRVQKFGVPLPPTFDTPTRQWPAGASGPFSEKLTGLETATDYYYKLCGADAGEQPVCANSQSFATRGPDGQDSVLGSWRVRQSADPSGGRAQARSDPSGANPRGSLEITEVTDHLHDFTGFVTCLRVEGNKATVGAVGLDQDENGTDHPSTAIASFLDRAQGDLFSIELQPGSTPPDCDQDFPAVNSVLISTIVVTDN